MFIWSVLAAKVFEVGMTVIDDITGTIGQFFRTELFGEEATYQAEDENAIAIVLRNNSEAMQYFAEAQMQLAEVQQQQNELKKAELMINVALAEKERELKAQLSELWRDLKRELQQNELNSRQDLQVRQIQADWDKIKLPTIFSRQELENLAQDTSHPLFVCAKMQITEGCPDYFRTELVADAESQIKKFANLVFQGNVRFYSRFFDDENIFDANAAQLKSILPNVPCVMSFSKITRRKAYFHYQLWGSRSAEILKGNFDVELPWREVAQQIRDQDSEAINDDDLYEIIGDWLTTLQKIYALFLVDLYAIVDGDDPFYSIKLDSVSFGVPEQTASQYIQPLAEILQRVQNERIEAFNEQLHLQQDEEENRQRQEELQMYHRLDVAKALPSLNRGELQRQEELSKQQASDERKQQEELRLQMQSLLSALELSEVERKQQEELRLQQEESARQEIKLQRPTSFKSSKGLYGRLQYEKLDALLASENWSDADELTKEIMIEVANHSSTFEAFSKDTIRKFPSQDLQTIDEIWVYHSDGLFGFSVQKRLLQECSNNWEEFCSKAGWTTTQKDWRASDIYNDFMFSDGYYFHASLPAAPFWFDGGVGVVYKSWWFELLSRDDL